MKILLPLLHQLESHLPNLDKTNSKVSNRTIGWQIDHCLLVINGIIGQIEISDPSKFKPKWTFPKFMVFTTGKIPRGKAKAPKVVIPNQVATQEELIVKLAAAKNNVLKLDSFSENQFFNHPYFKDLNVKQTKKFLAIHTKHHLKIIEDILK
jgi:hypothetical protein